MTFTIHMKKLVFGIAVVCMIGGTAHAQDWIWQKGSPGNDQVFDATSDGAGGCCYTGLTNGNYGGANQGNFDIIGGCVNTDGVEDWRGQWGTSAADSCEAICSDADGNVVMGGGSAGDFCCGGSNGGFDAVLLQLTDTGVENWRDQSGTNLTDGVLGVDCDADGNTVAAGFTDGSLYGASAGGRDGWVAGWDPAGTHQWGKQVGSTGTDLLTDAVILPPDTGVVTGWTTGSLGGANQGGRDIYVGSHNSDGSTNWEIQIGTPFTDQGSRIAVDSDGNLFVIGHTFGSLFDSNRGNADGFVLKLSPTGDLIWGRQFGTNQADIPLGLTIDGNGGVLAAGKTSGDFGGMNEGGTDAFVVHFDGDGNIGVVRQFGTGGSEVIYGIVLDNTEGVGAHFLVAGSTTGSLGGPNAGSWDVFVAKFPINPCPADLDNSGDVGVKDLLVLLGAWGPCKNCPADFDGSGDVGVKDLLVLLGAWGPCP